MPDGSVVHVRTSGKQGKPYPQCSSPWCRRGGRLECDHPIDEDEAQRKPPAVGDCRVHRVHNVLFYVRLVHEDNTVTVSRAAPGSKDLRSPRNVTVEYWFAQTQPTCTAHICSKCAKKVGELDFCTEHQRGGNGER